MGKNLQKVLNLGCSEAYAAQPSSDLQAPRVWGGGIAKRPKNPRQYWITGSGCTCSPRFTWLPVRVKRECQLHDSLSFLILVVANTHALHVLITKELSGIAIIYRCGPLRGVSELEIVEEDSAC